MRFAERRAALKAGVNARDWARMNKPYSIVLDILKKIINVSA